MKNILMLTPIYPGEGFPKTNTPVIHYFTREWVAIGYNVMVVHYPSTFPFVLRLGARLFYNYLCSKFNKPSLRTTKLSTAEYELDGVRVKRLPLSKNKPHGKYKKRVLRRAAQSTIDWCDGNHFTPDVILGHWVNPQAEIMLILKNHYQVPTCLVMHDSGIDFQRLYKEEWKKMQEDIDVFGFRSDAIKRSFESNFGGKYKWFYCNSGVPQHFLQYDDVSNKRFDKIKNFIYVGTLIKRKYPSVIIDSLCQSDIKDFRMTYIGTGNEREIIEKKIRTNIALDNRVVLTGQIDRVEVKRYLAQSDVFVMISSSETFGLVYLEAMAAGCITIASRDEGFDGIIKDGVNGFLCEAGNKEELTSIINRINSMSPLDLKTISANAQNTARQMTDRQVAINYIESVTNLIKE